MARPSVPKFGNWENDQDVPYTVYFEKARKGKNAGKIINPNDPANDMDMNIDKPPIQAPPFRSGEESDVRGGGSQKPKHERRLSKEDGDFRRQTEYSANSEHHRTVSSGDTPKRAGRQSGGPDRSVEHSPLHQHYQARTGGRGSGVSSPSWDRRSSEGSQGVAPHTPGRSRLRPVTRGDETPDRSAAVPKFGEWDENNPASADGFTHIFNKMREEKQSGSANAISMPDEKSYNGHKHFSNDNESTKVCCCCFPWGKK